METVFMKLTSKQLKQIVAEELRSVLQEAMITPFDPVQVGLQDPEVDERIKGLLRQKDPKLQQQGVELLAVLYPDDYQKDIDSYLGSKEYQKTFDDRTKRDKDVALAQELEELVKNLPGNIEIEFRNRGKAHIASKDLQDLENAVKILEKKYGFKFTISKMFGGTFLADFNTGIPFRTSALATMPYGKN